MNNEIENTVDELDEELVGAPDEWPQEGQVGPIDPAPEEEDLDVIDDKGPNRSAVMFLVVCGCAAVGIYLLGLRHNPKEVSAEQQAIEAKVDVALAKLLAQHGSGNAASVYDSTTDHIVQAFQDYPGKKQLMFDQLHRNPFSESGWQNLGSWLEAAGADEDDIPSPPKNFDKEFAKLQLTSIIHMPSYVRCCINGDILGEGQWVGGVFVIKTIMPDRVILTVDNRDFTLQTQ